MVTIENSKMLPIMTAVITVEIIRTKPARFILRVPNGPVLAFSSSFDELGDDVFDVVSNVIKEMDDNAKAAFGSNDNA